MTNAAWFALAGFAVTAPLDWLAVIRRDKRLEYVAKPAAMAWLIAFVLTVDGASGDLRTWWTAALVLSMLGDIFLMLPVDRFVFGLVAFLLGHLAYIGGFVFVDSGVEGLAVPMVVVALPALLLLQKMLGGPRMKPSLRLPVSVYVLVITVMAGCALASGSVVAGAGAVAFMTSDALIGWRRFVTEKAWMPIAIIVLYHLGQLGLAAFLLD